jgi:hypothetical protein
MNKIATVASIVGTLLCLYLPASPAQAQATRTWVSGVGDDANPCSRTAPCKTFAGAISKTAEGGEINALDPAGYGAVTITKAMTIDGGGGQVASVLVSGTNGIIVAAGPSDVVILRNLRINGVGTGLNGIRYISGRMLSVENTTIFGFTQAGISGATGAASILNVTGSNITNTADGINLTPTAGSLVSEISRTVIQKQTGNGIVATGSVFATVTNSNVVNAAGSGVRSATSAIVSVDSSSVSSNNLGFSTSSATILVSRNTIRDNNTNFSISGGAISSSGNNTVDFVTGAPNATITQQ